MRDYLFRISEIRQKQIVVSAENEDEAEEELLSAYCRGEIDFGVQDALTESMEIEHMPDDQKWIDEHGAGGYERLGDGVLAAFRSASQKETYRIWGSFETLTGDTLVLDEKGRVVRTEYQYPKFTGLTAEKEIDGDFVSFEPEGVYFSGEPYETEDILMSVFLSLMMEDGEYEVITLDPGLQKLVENYCAKHMVATVIDGKPVLLEILYRDGMPYEFGFITDRYLYYANGDQALMFDTKTRRIVSDNTFAEDGMWASIKNVKAGEETLLYGKLPNVDFDEDEATVI